MNQKNDEKSKTTSDRLVGGGLKSCSALSN